MIRTQKQLAYYFELHILKQNKIWENLKLDLTQKYLDQGFNKWFSEVKAEREVLQLRNLPKAVSRMNIAKEQTTQGDLD